MIIKNSFTRLSIIENNHVSAMGFHRMKNNFQEQFIEKWRIIGLFFFALILLGVIYVVLGVYTSLYSYFTEDNHTIVETVNFYGNIAYISIAIIIILLGFYFLSAKRKAEKIPPDNYESNSIINSEIISNEINRFYQPF